MPLVWLSKLNGYPYTERVYGPDLMLAFCRVAQKKGYSNFFYGGASSVAEKLVQNLRKRFPRLKVVGTYSPPYSLMPILLILIMNMDGRSCFPKEYTKVIMKITV